MPLFLTSAPSLLLQTFLPFASLSTSVTTASFGNGTLKSLALMAHIRADLEGIHDSGVLGQLDDPLAQLLRAGTNCKGGA
jgi:hypothetical protein